MYFDLVSPKNILDLHIAPDCTAAMFGYGGLHNELQTKHFDLAQILHISLNI